MNVSEISTRVKRIFGDEAGVQLLDSDIINWINDGQRQIAASSELLQTRAATNLTAMTMEYEFPPDFLAIRSIRAYGIRLKPIAMQEADDQFPMWDNIANRETGKPQVFWQWGDSFFLYPVPDESVVAGLVMYYTRIPTKVTLQTDSPELPELYHDRIVDFVMKSAYEMDENIQGATFRQTMFQTGMSSIAEDENKLTDEFYPVM